MTDVSSAGDRRWDRRSTVWCGDEAADWCSTWRCSLSLSCFRVSISFYVIKETQWETTRRKIFSNLKPTLILDTVSLRASSWCAEDSASRRMSVNTISFSLSCFFRSWTVSGAGTDRSTSSGISAWCWWCGWWLASIGEEGADQVLPFPRTGPDESSESDPVPWRELPWGRLERENALENELRSHDFFFIDGEGEGEQDPGSWEGDKDETELKFVACEVTLDTESLDNWRDMGGWLACDSDLARHAGSTPCLRNWSMNWRKSCNSFSWNEIFC